MLPSAFLLHILGGSVAGQWVQEGTRTYDEWKEQHCHLPGFLGITIRVVGSACQPWLTTPLKEDRGDKVEENTLISKAKMWNTSVETGCVLDHTFYCLFHWVSYEGSEVFCCDGRVRLGHEAVRSLPGALCEGHIKHGHVTTGTCGAHVLWHHCVWCN